MVYVLLFLATLNYQGSQVMAVERFDTKVQCEAVLARITSAIRTPYRPHLAECMEVPK